MYEIFEHTADMGIRARAPDFGALLADAACGLFAVIAGDLAQIRETDASTFAVRGADPTYLLFDWLDELLYAFDTRRMLFRRFDVHLDPDGIDATAFGERYDPVRHHLQHEVKAITYHQLAVQETNDGWEASVIVDI